MKDIIRVPKSNRTMPTYMQEESFGAMHPILLETEDWERVSVRSIRFQMDSRNTDEINRMILEVKERPDSEMEWVDHHSLDGFHISQEINPSEHFVTFHAYLEPKMATFYKLKYKRIG